MKRWLSVFVLCLGGLAAAQAPAEVTREAIRKQASEQEPLVLQTLRKLVEVESGSRDLEGLTALRAVIEAELAAIGVPYEVIATPAADRTGPMLLARLKGKGTSRIALIAHMDTVYKRGDLARQPFKVEAGKAYGLGISDDKSGVAMILHTLRMLTALKVDTFGELTVLINADEEIGSPSSRDRITRLGEESDLVISFEGSGVKSDYVRLATSSIARAKLTVKGRASHSGANPEFGRNALVELAHQILQMRDLSDPASGLKVNWTVAQAGRVANMIPSMATATADMRAQQMADFDAVETVMQQRIQKHLVPDTEVSIEVFRGRPPLNPTDKSRVVARQVQSIAEEIGWKLNVLEKPTGGGTDAAYAALRARGAVIESFGLQGFGAHSDDAEYVLVSSIQPRLYTTVRLIQDGPR
jgi:glutamate carboxypeptidase